jgi:hypothetical protein
LALFVYTVRCPFPSCSYRVKVAGRRAAQLAEQRHMLVCPLGRWVVETSIEMLTCRHAGCLSRFWCRRGGIADAQERRELHEKYCQHRPGKKSTAPQ